MVNHGSRPLRFTGCGSLNGDSVRCLPRFGPSQPVESGIVADSAAWRRHLEAMGPFRGMAGAGICGRTRIPVRADSGLGRIRDRALRVDAELQQRRAVHDRSGFGRERVKDAEERDVAGLQPEGQRGLREGHVAVLLQRVCHVGERGRRGRRKREEREAERGGERAARELHGGRRGFRGFVGGD